MARILKIEDFKTVVLRPLCLVGLTCKFLNKESRFPALTRLAKDAEGVKVLMSALEIFTKIPNAVTNLTDPVSGEPVRARRDSRFTSQNSPTQSPAQQVAKRLSTVARGITSIADVLTFAKHCEKPFRTSVMDLTPWIYVVTGGYMGAQALYDEWACARETWWINADENVPSAGKYHSCLLLASHAASLFVAIVGTVGAYYKDKAPSFLGNWQFAAQASSVVLGVVCNLVAHVRSKVVEEVACNRRLKQE
jgi:hypothetical protein